MNNSNVVILIVNMITSDSLVEVSVAATQDRCGKSYVKRLATNLDHHWCWMSAARFQPEVQADGPYTAIKFSA